MISEWGQVNKNICCLASMPTTTTPHLCLHLHIWVEELPQKFWSCFSHCCELWCTLKVFIAAVWSLIYGTWGPMYVDSPHPTLPLFLYGTATSPVSSLFPPLSYRLESTGGEWQPLSLSCCPRQRITNLKGNRKSKLLCKLAEKSASGTAHLFEKEWIIVGCNEPRISQICHGFIIEANQDGVS